MKRNPLKEYISFLPTQIKNRRDITPERKAVLGKLIQVSIVFMNKPYFYVGDKELSTCLEMHPRKIGEARNFLTLKNLIHSIKGIKGTDIATHYVLLFDTTNGNPLDKKSEIEIMRQDYNAKVEQVGTLSISKLTPKNDTKNGVGRVLQVEQVETLKINNLDTNFDTLPKTMERQEMEENGLNVQLINELIYSIKELEENVKMLTKVEQENQLKINELSTKIEYLSGVYNTIHYNTIHYNTLKNDNNINNNINNNIKENNDINKNNIIEKNGDINNILNVREEEPNELENNEELFKNIKPLEEVSKGTEDDGFDFQIKFSYDLSKTKTMKELQSLKNKMEQERKRMKPNPNGYYTQLLEKLVKEKEEELTPTDQVSFSTKSLNRELQEREELEEARLASQVANMSMFSEPIDDFPF